MMCLFIPNLSASTYKNLHNTWIKRRGSHVFVAGDKNPGGFETAASRTLDFESMVNQSVDVGYSEHCILGKRIAAVPVVSDLFGNAEFGTLSTLPAHADVSICGRGFNNSTARVRWNNNYYIVFLQDLGRVGVIEPSEQI